MIFDVTSPDVSFDSAGNAINYYITIYNTQDPNCPEKYWTGERWSWSKDDALLYSSFSKVDCAIAELRSCTHIADDENIGDMFIKLDFEKLKRNFRELLKFDS